MSLLLLLFYYYYYYAVSQSTMYYLGIKLRTNIWYATLTFTSTCICESHKSQTKAL